MRQQKRLTADEFALAETQVNMGPKGLDIARRVLVDGDNPISAAGLHGLDRTTASGYIKRIWKAHELVTAGLQEITAVLPPDKIAIVRAWETEEQIKRLQKQIKREPPYSLSG